MTNFNNYFDYSSNDFKVGDGICFNIDGLNKYYLNDVTPILKIHGRFPTSGYVNYCWKGIILS